MLYQNRLIPCGVISYVNPRTPYVNFFRPNEICASETDAAATNWNIKAYYYQMNVEMIDYNQEMC